MYVLELPPEPASEVAPESKVGPASGTFEPQVATSDVIPALERLPSVAKLTARGPTAFEPLQGPLPFSSTPLEQVPLKPPDAMPPTQALSQLGSNSPCACQLKVWPGHGSHCV